MKRINADVMGGIMLMIGLGLGFCTSDIFVVQVLIYLVALTLIGGASLLSRKSE